MYLLRLDDACPYMDVEKWDRVEKILDKHGIKPIVAIIPDCRDKMFTDAYVKDDNFWEKARGWQAKGWTVALHGYDHVYTNMHAKGINPINKFSEFVGLPLKKQCEKIRNGAALFEQHGLKPVCFVAPAHSFDENTIAALTRTTDIRVISDTTANDVYYRYGVFVIPQQAGSFRPLRMKTVTYCYHPNMMDESAFRTLDAAFAAHSDGFACFNDIEFRKRRYGLHDRFLNFLYFLRRKLKKYLKNDRSG